MEIIPRFRKIKDFTDYPKEPVFIPTWETWPLWDRLKTMALPLTDSGSV
jgi:hypothetical protein